ncbi:hypothetical protein DFQ27_006586 [Actinomortierella ambigua]|uniref:FAD-binding domain-containing protein n=1 Tax=Actinomortierella ambigua TaxID=1343610 RepID=A0A9P6PVC5_9FUNG|nr:hypothetical protein DFQ27_006586 [Actinomortierella ambigua]
MHVLIDYSYIITRPRLYEIMCKLIPKEKIAYGKKVLSIQQNSQGVMARCSDGEHLHADVLIGADGAYSSVRQNMFTQMMEKGLLPEEDASDPPFNTLCLSSCFSQPDGSVAWLVLQHAGSFKTRSEERFRSSEWGSEDAETMATTVRDLPSPFGHTLGYFIDNTPKTGISKVMLEYDCL